MGQIHSFLYDNNLSKIYIFVKANHQLYMQVIWKR